MIALGAEPDAVRGEPAERGPRAVRGGGGGPAPEPPVRLLYVGRLVEDKNLRRLLRAMVGLDARLVRVRHRAARGGELRSLADQLGVQAEFEGYVAPADLPARFAAAHALVLPSLYEPFGVAVREAAAAGLPVVCSRNAGAAGDFAVAGRNALLVDPPSERSIAEALATVVDDPAARERMAAESLALTAEHPLADDAAAFERAIIRAAGAGPPRADG